VRATTSGPRVTWYAKQSGVLSARFGSELDATFTFIEEQPLLYGSMHGAIRRALTRRFPYAIYFIAEGDRISVLRVLHHARDPREWQK
jgi:plasmid stabilization system protein ParE